MNRIKQIVMVAIASVFTMSAANANSIKKFNLSASNGFSDAPIVKIYSTNGEKWDKVDKTTASKFRIGLNAECKYEGKGNKAYRGSLSVPGFTMLGDHEPADFLIPNTHSSSGTFRFESGNEQPTIPTQVCADELQKRLSKDADLSKYSVLAKGFTVDYPAAFRVNFRLTCKPTGLGFTEADTKSVMVNARFQCAASDLAKEKLEAEKPKPVPPRRAKLTQLVKTISFAADPAEYTGSCPRGVAFKGSITASRPGTVEYRYISHDGKESPKLSLKFDQAGTRATRKWNRTVSKPDPGKTLSAGGQASEWDVQGWYRLEIISPAPARAMTARYKVNCQEPTPARAVIKQD